MLPTPPSTTAAAPRRCGSSGKSSYELGGEDESNFLLPGSVEPEQVADVVVAGLRDERFLILPHPEVAEYMQRKASDPDRWLAGMRRLQARLGA